MSVRTNPYVETDPKKLEEHAMDIMVAASEDSVFSPNMMGANNDAIIKTQGAKFDEANSVTMTMRALMRGAGVKGNANLDSNRDTLTYLHMKVGGDVMANSVLSEHTKITNKTVAKNFRRDAKDGLTDWYHDKTERIKLAKLSEACTNIVVVKADGTVVDPKKIADATDGLGAGDRFGTHTIDEMLKRAENGWIDADGVRHPRVRPWKKKTIIDENGVKQKKGVYMILIGTESEDNIGKDPIYLAHQEALANAGVKDDFYTTGLIGQYKNAIIVKKSNWSREYAGIITSDIEDFEDYAGGFSQYAGKGGIVTEVNLLLGATAAMNPFQEIPDYIEDSEDSGRKMSSALDIWWGFEKTKYVGKTAQEKASIWHGKDYGVIAAPAVLDK